MASAFSFSEPLSIQHCGHPILRQKAVALTKDQIQSPSLQTLIQQMRQLLRKAPGVGLAAPQLGFPIQLIILEDLEEYHVGLTPQQLLERERYAFPFQALINPRILKYSSEQTFFFEGCLSVPDLVAIVPRSLMISVEALNEDGNRISFQARGWFARILQHEIDHLEGKLYLDRADLRTLMTRSNYESLWKNLSVQDIYSELGSKIL